MTVLADRSSALATRVRRLPFGAPSWSAEADVVVVGAGAAGLSAARVAAAAGRRVLLLVKGLLGSGSTALAQGGLAAVVSPEDSYAAHAADTVTAGAGLCDPVVVDALVRGAGREVAALRRLGARFDRSRRGGLALTREGGHGASRVVHAGGDASGAEVDRVLRSSLTGVEVQEQVVLLDVLLDSVGRVAGVLAGRRGADGALAVGVVRCSAVVLATGGYGQAWATTTNPPGMTGDGLAAALRAGAVVRDVEFVQFHPTVFYAGPHARGRQLLLTEALRGEGAVLVDDAGRRVMAGRHPLADLAPRDVVAASLASVIREGGRVFLDATGLGVRTLEHRFPTVLAACRAYGVDPATEPVPVAPGAHYSMGGVAADLDGRTSVPGLFAVGEAASTGVHGANRLASNSLTEALLTGRRCGALLAAALPDSGELVLPSNGTGVDPSARGALVEAMSRHAGVLRDGAGLSLLHESASLAPGAESLTLEVVETTSIQTVASLVALAGATRTESRGAHRRTDFPATDPQWQRHISLRLVDEEVVAW